MYLVRYCVLTFAVLLSVKASLDPHHANVICGGRLRERSKDNGQSRVAVWSSNRGIGSYHPALSKFWLQVCAINECES